MAMKLVMMEQCAIFLFFKQPAQVI